MAEAERKAQQDKLYFLDIERILGGGWAWLWALPNLPFRAGGGAGNALSRVRVDCQSEELQRLVLPKALSASCQVVCP